MERWMSKWQRVGFECDCDGVLALCPMYLDGEILSLNDIAVTLKEYPCLSLIQLVKVPEPIHGIS